MIHELNLSASSVSASGELPRLRVDPEILARYPGYSVLAIYARDLKNGPSDDASIAALREAESAQRLAFGENRPASHPHIAAWREAFGAFGAKPSKYLCSAEALLGRTLKGNDLPAINQIVDYYNAVSVKHVLPAGGEDWDFLDGDGVLKFADGTEPFDSADGGGDTVSYPEVGEAIWADRSGVTCRRWNWRQCRRTRLTETTTNAYFVLDRLDPYPLTALIADGDELIAHLRSLSPNADITTDLIGNQT